MTNEFLMTHEDVVKHAQSIKAGDCGTPSEETFLTTIDFNNTWYGTPTHEDGSEWSYWELVAIYESV